MTDDEILVECRKTYARFSTMSIPWEDFVSDSGDEQRGNVEVSPKIDPKNMSVKAETEADREKLWDAVKDYARS